MNIAQTLQQAIAHHQAGELQDAEKRYRSILMEEPKHADANHNLGVLLKQGEKVDIALPFFKTALESNPNQGQFWVSYIEALIQLEKPDAARSVLKQGQAKGLKGDVIDQLASQLKLSQGKIDSVIALYSSGHIEESLNLIDALLKDYPDEARLYNLSGSCHKALDQLDKAVKSYEQALIINPNFAEAHSNLGNTLKALGQLDAAVKRYEKALVIKPNYADAHYNLGNTLKALGQLDAAVHSYEKALEVKPNYVSAHTNLGVTLNELGQLDAAIKCYEQVLEIKPNCVDAHNNLGSTLYDLGQLEAAVERYEKVLEIKPNYVSAYTNLGVSLKDLGQLGLAIKHFEQALAIKPDDADSLIQLSIYAWINQDLKKLKCYLTTTLDLSRCSYKSLKFVDPYRVFLTRLLEYQESNPQEYLCKGHSSIIHVLGDSHCLSAANTNVKFMEESYSMKSNIIIGCKAWHLTSDQPNGYKTQFEAIVKTIPRDGVVILTFGEIDCRTNEGIIKFHQKTQNNLSHSIKVLTHNYIKYLVKSLVTDSRTIIVSGIPCISERRQEELSTDDLVILSSVINEFNNGLKTNVINAGFKFLDVFSLTQERFDECYIDRHHLTPAAFINAVQTRLI